MFRPISPRSQEILAAARDAAPARSVRRRLRPLAPAAFFLLCAAACSSARASGISAVDSLYSRAEKSYLAGDFAVAAGRYAETLRLTEGGSVGVGPYVAERQRRARLLMARSLERSERWEEAILVYRRALEETPLLSDSIAMGMARCHAERNEFEQAVALLRGVVDAEERTTLYLSAVEQLADVHRIADQHDVAVQWYRVLLKESPGYDDQARAHLKIGLTLADRGDRDAAMSAFARVVNEFPRSRYARDALEEGRGLSRAFTDRYRQGLVLYNCGRYRESAEFFAYYLRHDVDGRFRSQAAYFLGRSHQRIGSYGSAVGDYRDVIASGPQAEYFDLAWSKLAYCLRATGQTEESLRTCDEFAELFPDGDGVAEVLWEKSRLLEEKLLWDDAIEAFVDLASRYPASARAGDALFRAGLCLFKLRRYDEADASFTNLSVGRNGSEAARALFWAGKSREAMGELDAAATRYQEAVAAARDSYYGRRAFAKLGVPYPRPALEPATVLPGSGGLLGQPFRRISGLQGFAAWLAEWYPQVYLPGERIDLVRMMRADPAFVRADAFMSLHMTKEAERELSLLEDIFGSDPRMLDILIGYYEAMGLNKRAIGMAEWILRLSPADSFGDAPPYLRRKICPAHFAGMVDSECGARAVDPRTFYSLMRQESLFEPDAVSWVGARGLSQIMPETGRWIARKLGERGFRTSDLLDPETNIRFGVYYLSVQLEDFDGDVMRALAAYNGGPENVGRWWDYGGGCDSDVFVEDIGYEQTNDYVRRVYLYGEFYRELEGAAAR